MALSENPAWVTRALRDNWTALERLVGEDRMPLLSTVGGPHKGMQPEELGSGHYGTVMPTHADGIVMKVTSDPTEAIFVAAALSVGEWPEGVVRYERIVSLPEMLRGRGVFVIWREEAEDVGVELAEARRVLSPTVSVGGTVFDGRRYLDHEGMQLIMFFKEAAALLRAQKSRPFPPGDTDNARDVAHEVAAEATDRKYGWYSVGGALKKILSWRAPRGAFRTQVLYELLDWCFDMMENTNGVHLVGEALRFYFEHAILLADVHTQNIGRVRREDYTGPINVITDPGHAVLLDGRYDKVKIPTLYMEHGPPTGAWAQDR